MSQECPVSRLNRAESIKSLAHQFFMADYLRSCMISQGMGGGSGPVALYGPDLSEWPSYAIDAAEEFYAQKTKLHGRMYDADHPAVPD